MIFKFKFKLKTAQDQMMRERLTKLKVFGWDTLFTRLGDKYVALFFSERPTKRLFSYVNHDKFTNQKEVSQAC